MFVITADQIDSRTTEDAVRPTIAALSARLGERLTLQPERTAGDEFQLLVNDGASALDSVLLLTREGTWSVGLGIGDVHTPLPTSTREAAGDAFIGARVAVDRAKKKLTRFAVDAPAAGDRSARIESLIDLLLTIRSRRSPEGWQLFDLLETGLTQAASATRLGITPQAASRRAQAADLRIENPATVAIASLLDETAEAARRKVAE